MIYDNISNIELYKKFDKRLYAVLSILRDSDFLSVPVGRVEILDNETFANITELQTTLQDKDYEAHKNYIDVFYVVTGEAKVFVTSRNLCSVTVPYNAEKDVERLCGEKLSEVILCSGMFLVCFPNDVHKPGIAVGEGAEGKVIKQVVIKIYVQGE